MVLIPFVVMTSVVISWLGNRPFVGSIVNLTLSLGFNQVESILKIISLLLGIFLAILTIIQWFQKNSLRKDKQEKQNKHELL